MKQLGVTSADHGGGKRRAMSFDRAVPIVDIGLNVSNVYAFIFIWFKYGGLDVQLEAYRLGRRHNDGSLTGLCSLSSRLCKRRQILCGVKRVNTHRPA
jgi:hypothetical protein